MSPVEFEPTISAGKRPQTYALDRAATGTGARACVCVCVCVCVCKIIFLLHIWPLRCTVPQNTRDSQFIRGNALPRYQILDSYM